MENKHRQFTCHFCNKTIQDDTEFGHISVCGSVLVPCPHKCGSYVTRLDLHKHQKECMNRTQTSRPKLPKGVDGNPNLNISSLDRKSDPFNKNIEYLLIQTQNDIASLAKRLSNVELRFDDRSPLLLKQLGELKTAHLRQNQELINIRLHNQVITEWRKAIDFHLDALRQSLASFELAKTEKDIQWRRCEQQIQALESTHNDMELYKKQFLKERDSNREAILEVAKQIDHFKSFFERENAATASLWNDQKLFLESLDREVVGINKVLVEQKAKYTNTAFDVKTISQISSESAEKLEILERKFKKLQVEVEHMKLDVESLEDMASGGYNFNLYSSKTGHIVWMITDFDEKLSKAKEHNSVVKSPIFFTHDFGYRIRILVYLNGLKKWKDRYALISIHILKGEFDALLKWPCHVEGSVILRDLEDLDNPKHFVKYISAKRQTGDEDNEEPQESSTSYIFIPHGTLTKSKYLKNDTVYLEVKIKQNTRSMETVL